MLNPIGLNSVDKSQSLLDRSQSTESWEFNRSHKNNENSRTSDKHRQEWLNSGVHPDIIHLNVHSIDGSMGEDSPIAFLTQNATKNKTPAFGGLPKSLLKRYRHTDAGGWIFQGVDLLTGLDSDWGCFKPDTPYQYFDTNQQKLKTVKYEHPTKTPTEVFAPKIPDHLWWTIAEQHTVDLTCPIAPSKDHSHELDDHPFISYEFWDWVKDHPELPIIITEGAKKAGAILSCGQIAIALPGIYNGYRQPRDEEGKPNGLANLIPQLQTIASQGREIAFCFDNDPKPKTRKNVRKAIEKTGKLFAFKGCQVSVMEWQGDDKGIDDLIVNQGVECFEKVYQNRISLDDYKLKTIQDLTSYIDLTIHEKYFPESLTIPENAKLIGLKGLHGIGKTEWLSKKIQPYLNQGQRVVIITHREQLSRELANRFGVDYRTEITQSETKGELGYALCIDSLHPHANPSFNPEDWSDAIVIIDEIEQVLWHLLNGSTCQKKRVSILKTLRKLLRTVALSEKGKIFISDADLSPIGIDYIEQLIGYQQLTGFNLPRFIVNNTYLPNENRKMYRYQETSPSELISKLKKDLAQGKKVIIHTDGQKHRSTYGTRSLEALIRKLFPELKVLRIDRKSIKDRNHPAYQCIAHINQIVTNYNVVICSPVIETGISITVKHFDAVYALSHGTLTVNSTIQAFQRVRDDIPRHIWLKSFSPNKVANGEYDLQGLLSSENKLAVANINLLQRMGVIDRDLMLCDDETYRHSPDLMAWAKRVCLINYQADKYADYLFTKCQSIGYQVIDVTPDPDPEKSKAIRKEMKEIKDKNYRERNERIAQKDKLSFTEYQELRDKQKLGISSEAEDESLEKTYISDLYMTEDVTPELVEKHDLGWSSQLQLHYYMTVGQLYLKNKEKKMLAKLKDPETNEVFKPDLNRSSKALIIFALKTLNIEQFFGTEKTFTHDSLQEWYQMISTPDMKYQIKAILGFRIGEKDTPISVAQRILKVIGLKLTFDGLKTINGKRVRVYRGCDPNYDGRSDIFKKWLERDSELYQESEIVA